VTFAMGGLRVRLCVGKEEV